MDSDEYEAKLLEFLAHILKSPALPELNHKTE